MLLTVSALLVACQATAPEDTFVEATTINEKVETISGAPVKQEESVDHALNVLNQGGTTTLAGNDIPIAGPTSTHAGGLRCSQGESLCASGVCAAVCPQESLTDQGNGGGFNVEFPPKEVVYAKAPNVEGSAKQFTKLATNHADEQTRITSLAIQNAEEAAGLSGASDHEANQMKTQKLAAEKQGVDAAMNKAAAAAAAYKASDASHTAATVAVAQAKTAEAAQEATVAKAKETLQHEKEKLAAVKVELRKKREAKNNAMYHAEAAAGEYETLKASAIAKDNALQEYIAQEKQKIKYRAVAEAAVEKQAAEDLKKQEMAAASDLTKKAEVPPTAAQHKAVKTAKAAAAAFVKPAATSTKQPVCADCSDTKDKNGKTVSGLPAVYAKAEGFCTDCAEWKQAGQCEDPKYKTFMAHYCQKSCGCKGVATAHEKSAAAVPPTTAGVKAL